MNEVISVQSVTLCKPNNSLEGIRVGIGSVIEILVIPATTYYNTSECRSARTPAHVTVKITSDTEGEPIVIHYPEAKIWEYIVKPDDTQSSQ